MTRTHKPDDNEPVAPAHAHSWIWLVMAVIALSGIANAIG